MRWIVVALILCNVIYWLWHQSNDGMGHVVPGPSITVPDDARSLELLTEIESAPVQSLPTVAVEPVPETEVNVPSKEPAQCWLIGPFLEKISQQQVSVRLAALDIVLAFKEKIIEDDSDYWVHLAPQPSRKAAIKLLRQLQASDIDSFLITEGELNNGISLGLFTQQDRAKKIQAQRVAQGYDAKINEVIRTHTEQWALFDGQKYGDLTEDLWKKILEGNKGLERRKFSCDTIASANHFD
jgi:hypothetical protein